VIESAALASIERFIGERLATWEVPGCAVAAVKDGEVVLASGWGTRDVAADLPVTRDTLFAIGSVTKAFTAATVGALVDDGLLGWDSLVRDYLPGLRLADPVVSDRVTVADLLSHRSGMARHDLAWLAHPEWSRAEVVRRLRFLPLGADLRQEFRYCNLGYALVGHLVDVLSGIPWEEFLRARMLTPLGMHRSNLTVDDMHADPDSATGYERREDVMVPVLTRESTAAAPAGAINSSAADMARWLLAQAGGGSVDGTQVMSPGTVARQYTPHMLVPENRTFPESTRYAYGFGWMLGQYRGHRIAEHGGGVEGFVCDCAVLPDDRVGVAVLTNTWSGGAFASTVVYRLLDELLGLEPRDWSTDFKARAEAGRAGGREARAARRVVPGAPPPRPQAAYAGEYEHPGYGAFSVTADGDTLRPRFGDLDLSLSHRHYEVFDLEWHERGGGFPVMPLTFLSDPDGYVTALTVPLDPATEPIRFDRLPDAQARDPQVLRRLCGTYTMGPVSVVVGLARDTVLTVTVSGAPPMELLPGPGLRFEVRGAPGVTAEFELDEAGEVTRLIAQPVGIFLPAHSDAPESASPPSGADLSL
jgi:CubicO group peptidase (beta-lactamase class C family)